MVGPGAAHFFVFWAFLILATVYLEAYGSLLKLLLNGGEGPMDWAIPMSGTGPSSVSCRTSSR